MINQSLSNSSALGGRSKVIEFADLRLPQPMDVGPRVLIEYEDQQGGLSVHEVSLTCSGQGVGGAIYLGGFDAGKFSVFRADGIRRVSSLEMPRH